MNSNIVKLEKFNHVYLVYNNTFKDYVSVRVQLQSIMPRFLRLKFWHSV